MTRDEAEELVRLWDADTLFADGFDEAIIGIAEARWGNGLRVVYSLELCLSLLMRDMGMEEDEAREYFEFNVAGSYVGENTPLFIITESL